MSVLNAAQLAAFSTAQVRALSTANIAALDTIQIAQLTSQQINALTTGQIAALDSDQVSAMDTHQFAALSSDAEDIGALSTAAVRGLTTGQLAILASDQIVSLTSSQVAALGSAQIAAPRALDLTQAPSSGLEPHSLARIDLAVGDASLGNVVLNAASIAYLGEMGHGDLVQMRVTGDSSSSLTLNDPAEQWQDLGTTNVDGQTYQVMQDGDIQLLVALDVQLKWMG